MTGLHRGYGRIHKKLDIWNKKINPSGMVEQNTHCMIMILTGSVPVRSRWAGRKIFRMQRRLRLKDQVPPFVRILLRDT